MENPKRSPWAMMAEALEAAKEERNAVARSEAEVTASQIADTSRSDTLAALRRLQAVMNGENGGVTTYPK
jgi:hypothetical protein